MAGNVFMSNAGLQALISEFGDRICALLLDNGTKVYIGYKGSPCKSVNDLEFKTYGGIDMFSTPMPTSPTGEVHGRMWHSTEDVQGVLVMDEDYEDERADPLRFS